MNQHHGLNEAEPLREEGREGEGRAPEGGREGEREDTVSGLRGVLIKCLFSN